MSNPVLLMDSITKVYSNGFVANKNVTLSVQKGEIHALLGENGAGKTTLMKILFGIEKPEEGKIYIYGKEVSIKNTFEAIKLGVGMVHQHFMLLENLTVAENIVLGMEPKKGFFLDREKAISMTKDICKKYDLIVNPNEKIKNLSVGMKQKVEILKVLMHGANIIILDEPTAVLTPQETKELFVELTNLKNNGYTIIFISHKLNEVKEICDRFTILRDGKVIATDFVKNVSEQQISKLMVDRDISFSLDKSEYKSSKNIVKVRNLSVLNKNETICVDNISFNVRYGGILGIVGVEGNGQTEISEVLSGMNKDYQGDIFINDIDIRHKSIRQIREMGVSHISEDRMTYGCAADLTINDNIISDRFYKKEYNRGFLLDYRKINAENDKLIQEFLIKCNDRGQPIKMLSGGNIQKVISAREFSNNPQFVIANQPTRGIDIGAAEFIRNKLVSLRDMGSAVLLISADLNEVFQLCDSIIIVYNGKIVAYIPNIKEVDETIIGEYMLGLKVQPKEEIERIII